MPTVGSKALCELLSIEVPIVQAPMAGVGTPELVAAVSSAGGLGSLACAYLPPEEIRALAARTRSLTSRPVAINLFAKPPAPPPADAAPMLAALEPLHRELGIE